MLLPKHLFVGIMPCGSLRNEVLRLSSMRASENTCRPCGWIVPATVAST